MMGLSGMLAKAVVSLGGSVVNPGRPDVSFVKKVCRVFNSFRGKLAILVGGGAYAREYAKAIRLLGGNEYESDIVAIEETRQNAMLVKACLKDVYPKIPETFEEASIALKLFDRVVMGGTIPGITTDADAVLLAEKINAKRIINISNVDGVYDKDPSRFKAKKFSKLSINEFYKMALQADKRKAGQHFIFDVVAIKLAMRSRLEIHFVGKNLKDIENAIKGKKHGGTVVSASSSS